MKLHVPLSCGKITYHAEVTEGDDLGETTRALYTAAGQLRIVCCIAGGEAGVDAADLLSERLQVRTNGAQGVFANRRDKKVQQELIAQAGIRSVRQAAGKKFEDVREFLLKEEYPVVLKPTDSAGTDGVK
jgi:biotin carboxylase